MLIEKWHLTTDCNIKYMDLTYQQTKNALYDVNIHDVKYSHNSFALFSVSSKLMAFTIYLELECSQENLK